AVRGGDGGHVPRVLPGFFRGAGLRRTDLALPPSTVGPLGPVSARARGHDAHGGPGGTGTPRQAASPHGGVDGGRGTARCGVRRGGVGHGPAWVACPGGRLPGTGWGRLACKCVPNGFSATVPGLPVLARPAGAATPPGLSGYGGSPHSGQHQCVGTLRGPGTGMGAPGRWFGGGTPRLRPARGL